MREKVFDDLAGVMGGAAGLFSDLRDQMRGDMRDRLKEVADRIDLVTRGEMLALEARIEALEAQLGVKTKAAPKAKKPAAKKTPQTKKKAKR
ncbi:MAG TPA: hypothetical protein VIN59_04620 [Alphaproteobacteria bacterium]